jgi:hypothetical protein
MRADALDAKTVTLMPANKHAQIFATRHGWCRTFPLKTELEAHEAASTLFTQDDGVPNLVPNVIVIGGARECRD